MNKNQILKKLEQAGFYMPFVVDCSKNYLEVFSGDACDFDGNQHIKDEAVKATGLTHSCNITYGGYMLSNESFNIDSDNKQ
jgi:hypothetical protein